MSPPDVKNQLTRDGIQQLRELIEFLVKEQNIIQEGIFRRTGSLVRQNELKTLISKNKPLRLDEGTYNVHDCASVFKGYLADLPEPLLTEAYHPIHLQLAEICNNTDPTVESEVKDTRLHQAIQLLVHLLPEENRLLLHDTLIMLNQIIKYESKNKMSADSLATLFTPHLICPRKLTAESLHTISQSMSSVISFMITKGESLFDIPATLATDIRAYLVGNKRKHTASTNVSTTKILDESISSDSTANTVFTFIDREKTAAAQDSNPTDTALAQLYAHIQSLPESSKKRKLIKKFNKQNGHGTPLQHVMSNRMKSTPGTLTKSRTSLGDSIKKHIFNKSLLSKTPKTECREGYDTPTRGKATPNLKMRVLFQSPIATTASVTTTPTVRSTVRGLENIGTPISRLGSPQTPINRANSRLGVLEGITDHDNDVDHQMDDEKGILDSKQHDNIKKTVLFAMHDIDIDDESYDDLDDEDYYSPILERTTRYKSEPNLSKMNGFVNGDDSGGDTSSGTPSKRGFLANKLIKGVSLGNLRFPGFRSGKNKSLDFLCDSPSPPTIEAPETVTSTTFEVIKVGIGVDGYGISDNAMIFDRNSMSPITKSTQRMPKSMQESIMTPRSRKPVILLGANLDPNASTSYKCFSNFNEADEDETLLENLDKNLRSPSIFPRSKSYGDVTENKKCSATSTTTSFGVETLTNEFRDYLFSRSCMTASPVDLSFSSQPDDFGSRPDIRDLSESEMSESLLFCLDGNRPADLSLSDEISSPVSLTRKRLANASVDSDLLTSSKKVAMLGDGLDETSL